MQIRYDYSPVKYEESIESDPFSLPIESYVTSYNEHTENNSIKEILYDSELSASAKKHINKISINNNIHKINQILDEELYYSSTGQYFADESDISSVQFLINQNYKDNDPIEILTEILPAETITTKFDLSSPKDIINHKYYVTALLGNYICFSIGIYLLAYVFPGQPVYHNYAPVDMRRLLLIINILFAVLTCHITLHHYTRPYPRCECYFIYNIVIIELTLLFFQLCVMLISLWCMINMLNATTDKDKHAEEYLDAYRFRIEIIMAFFFNALALLFLAEPLQANQWMRNLF